MGVNFLSSMLPRICKAAGTETIYTNHCLRSTVVQKLSDAGLEAREIISITGHKCESSLQSYWCPNYNERRCWSNILASDTAKNKRVQKPESPLTVKRSANMFDPFFSNCTINGDVQINVTKHPDI